MGKPDAMSQRHDLNEGENDNVNITVLSPCHFRTLQLQINQEEIQVEGLDMVWHNQIKDKTPSCTEPEVLKAITQKQPGVCILEDGCITWQGKLYVPEIPKL